MNGRDIFVPLRERFVEHWSAGVTYKIYIVHREKAYRDNFEPPNIEEGIYLLNDRWRRFSVLKSRQ